MVDRDLVLALAEAIDATFSRSHWTDLAYLISADERIWGHPRLLRSLEFGDDDYRDNVIETVHGLLEDDPTNLGRILRFGPIAAWLKSHSPEALARLEANACGVSIPGVLPDGYDVATAALTDAQVLLDNRNPTSAIDRVHTGLHSFLRQACLDSKIEVPEDASASCLLSCLRDHHPALRDHGPWGTELRKILRTSGAILDALGTLRNNASLAHPNDTLLGHDEALLAINIARSLLGYLHQKFDAARELDAAAWSPDDF